MTSQFQALISLLDDSDKEVFGAVTAELAKEGLSIIPQLEDVWEKSQNSFLQARIEEVIHHIQFNITKSNLEKWSQDGAKDILEGYVYICQSQYPGIDLSAVHAFFDKLKTDICIDVTGRTTAADKVKLINYVLFQVYQFERNTTDLLTPENLYINQVIEKRRGNPLSLAIVYLIVGQKLGLPIFGIDLPNSILLAYKNEYRHIDSLYESDDILFYINPYNKGARLSIQDIKYHLENFGYANHVDQLRISSNKTILLKVIDSLVSSYEKLGFNDKIAMLNELSGVIRINSI